METKNGIPKGYNSITPYISVNDAIRAIEFYKKAFGATEVGRISMPDGSIAHAELEINGSKIWLSEENQQWGNKSPKSLGGSPVSLCLYVDNVDVVFSNAIKEGAKVIGEMEVKDQFYGDRAGSLIDPFGHNWTIMTHKQDVSFDEMQERTNTMFATSKA